MLHKIKKISLMLVLGMLFMIPFLSVEARSTRPPTFEDHFAKPLIEWKTADGQWTERVFNIESVSRDKDIRENIEALFFPKWNGGVLREILKICGIFPRLYRNSNGSNQACCFCKKARWSQKCTCILYYYFSWFRIIFWCGLDIFNIDQDPRDQPNFRSERYRN